MYRNRLLLPLAGALALAACSSDRSEPLAPAASPRSVGTTATAAGRYIVLSSSGAAFASDFGSRVAALGGAVESQHDGAGIAVVTGLSATAASQLANVSDVSNVVADVEISINSPVAPIEADASDVTDAAAGDPSATSQANPATAARYPFQWNMRLIGANQAWAAGKLGSSSVTAAILDTGIDYDAPDLNGLVDLSRSTSFVPSDNTIRATYFPTRNNISDFQGHGTNVATQVSSKAVALAGVTSRTTLIGVKVLNWQGHGNSSYTINGLLWAADHGADVANMSLGGGFSKAGNGQLLSAIIRSLNYANRKGMLVVVAAGNEGTDLDHDGNMAATYCSMPSVVCVSAVGPAVASAIGAAAESAPSYYTNYGRSSIDVAAPGGNAAAASGFTVSAWPWGNDIASWVWSYCSKTRFAGVSTAGVPSLTVCAAGNRLTGMIGTSQATPHVAGLAALLVAEKGHGIPSQIKAAIEQSALDLGAVGTDPYYGKGRISVAKALGL